MLPPPVKRVISGWIQYCTILCDILTILCGVGHAMLPPAKRAISGWMQITDMPLHWWRSARARMWFLGVESGLLKRVSHFRDGWKLHRGSLWARPWQDGLLQSCELFIIHICNHLITHQYHGRAGISYHERELTLFFHESVDKPAHLTIAFLWVLVSDWQIRRNK